MCVLLPGHSLQTPAGYKEGDVVCDRNARNGRIVFFFLSSGILRSVLNELVFVRLLQLELMHVLLVLRWPRLVCLRRVRPLFI